MPHTFHTIVLPTRPQPDTLVGIFLLKTFGRQQFPGIPDARIEVVPALGGRTEADFAREGAVLIDIGGGAYDHHDREPKTTVSRLIAEDLGISQDPALAKLLEYAQRDDFYGKGTLSADPLDRAFGLSALVAALNKQFPKEPNAVMDAVLPLLEAHLQEEVRRHEELPREFADKKARGDVIEFEVRQRDKKLRVVMVKSDNPSMAGFLRSALGGKYDVVLQRGGEGHTNILTRPAKRIDLRGLVAVIRVHEAERRGYELDNEPYKELTRSGRHHLIKEWYYDPATNSIQNGGLNPQDVEATQIGWDAFPDIVREGLAGAL